MLTVQVIKERSKSPRKQLPVITDIIIVHVYPYICVNWVTHVIIVTCDHPCLARIDLLDLVRLELSSLYPSPF